MLGQWGSAYGWEHSGHSLRRLCIHVAPLSAPCNWHRSIEQNSWDRDPCLWTWENLHRQLFSGQYRPNTGSGDGDVRHDGLRDYGVETSLADLEEVVNFFVGYCYTSCRVFPNAVSWLLLTVRSIPHGHGSYNEWLKLSQFCSPVDDKGLRRSPSVSKYS